MTQSIQTLVQNRVSQRPQLQPYAVYLEQVSSRLIEAFSKKHRLYFCGNGGSSADANHIASEFIKNFSMDRGGKKTVYQSDEWTLQKGLPAFSLCQTSNITAIANDMSYSLVFAQQIYVYCEAGDVLILLSTSGKSQNILRAIQVAKEAGVYTIGISNGDGMLSLCDYGVKILQSECAGIQEDYMSFLHALCWVVERAVFS